MDTMLIAAKAVQTMLDEDQASKAMGMELQTIQPGYAEVSMNIREDMVNGHNTAHGGIVFSLADTAFACACNSHNVVNVAASCQINFMRPALLGDVLLAKATELSLGRRSGVYDVHVTNQAGKLVAVFRGHAMSLDKPVFTED
ncbi:MAG TPA: hydroxyphenylacetyl-CoA thioesterase PaaI [Hellea balneolensis]|uniref:Hydroxyphenylacetyl-CoA thioesterase PaaI n=1 Tax=Hellea balneolensis TaxID=287478 RepID=A0A7C3FZH7_9PROT|nr:hydroxyphenylacetyl-CoA thioesterase PaaI [Hellea balneolensis]